MRLAYLRSREKKSRSQRVVGDEARELGLTVGQVTEIVGQGKELYTVSKYSQGTCMSWRTGCNG